MVKKLGRKGYDAERQAKRRDVGETRMPKVDADELTRGASYRLTGDNRANGGLVVDVIPVPVAMILTNAIHDDVRGRSLNGLDCCMI